MKKILSIWNPKKIKFFHPVRLSLYPKRTKAELNLIDRNPWRDSDKDRVPNWFDCRPLNRKKQGTNILLMTEIAKTLRPKTKLYGKTISISKARKYRAEVHKLIKEASPKRYKKEIESGKVKLVSPYDIVRVFAKDPTLYSKYKEGKLKIDIMPWTVKGRKKAGITEAEANRSGALYYSNRKKVYVKPLQEKKRDIRTILKHELAHSKQPLKEMHTEERIIEKEQLKGKRKLKYREMPTEIEAFKEEKKPTELDIAKKEGAKPEVLEYFD